MVIFWGTHDFLFHPLQRMEGKGNHGCVSPGTNSLSYQPVTSQRLVKERAFVPVVTATRCNNVLDPCNNEFSFTRLIVEDMLLLAVTLTGGF